MAAALLFFISRLLKRDSTKYVIHMKDDDSITLVPYATSTPTFFEDLLGRYPQKIFLRKRFYQTFSPYFENMVVYCNRNRIDYVYNLGIDGSIFIVDKSNYGFSLEDAQEIMNILSFQTKQPLPYAYNNRIDNGCLTLTWEELQDIYTTKSLLDGGKIGLVGEQGLVGEKGFFGSEEAYPCEKAYPRRIRLWSLTEE